MGGLEMRGQACSFSPLLWELTLSAGGLSETFLDIQNELELFLTIWKIKVTFIFIRKGRLFAFYLRFERIHCTKLTQFKVLSRNTLQYCYCNFFNLLCKDNRTTFETIRFLFLFFNCAVRLQQVHILQESQFFSLHSSAELHNRLSPIR